ncbi:Putative ubiquitin carboxyl-terminal hydrolase 41 [Cricetulus griseus]|uniref:Putative ubiquitin carboxyl-terminal hydrolase 41 n=1 Tax=Cricetulus griseus TaxID=10029 RepID=G3HQ79_CRIGR|nr:Putative ubiquitin carboxyl-terminal hydrolase 41 [Cricetulus griseus]
MNEDFRKILKRITVPRGPEEQKRSVPFQLLLLLEKMQDSRQKAVLPMELAYCLQKYNVSCKSPLCSGCCPLIQCRCMSSMTPLISTL